MAEADRTRLRATFDEAAGRYDRARPGYPPAVFDDLAELAGVGPGCRAAQPHALPGCAGGRGRVRDSAAAYLELLPTSSGHIAMAPHAREGRFACIADLIERRHGGRISKRHLTELQVARAT